MEEKKIDKLYELLERAEREHDIEAAAALRCAIFQLESRQAERIRLFCLLFFLALVIMDISI